MVVVTTWNMSRYPCTHQSPSHQRTYYMGLQTSFRQKHLQSSWQTLAKGQAVCKRSRPQCNVVCYHQSYITHICSERAAEQLLGPRYLLFIAKYSMLQVKQFLSQASMSSQCSMAGCSLARNVQHVCNRPWCVHHGGMFDYVAAAQQLFCKAGLMM